MGGIYLSGGAGIGKRTFCMSMSSHYQIPMILDVVKSIYKRHPYISDLSLIERNLIFTLEYFKIHLATEPPRFLSNSSLLYMLAWHGCSPDVVHYLGINHVEPDLMVLLPPPPYEWYQKHSNATEDTGRVARYAERGKISRRSLKETEALALIYEHDQQIFRVVRSMCRELEWVTYIPSYEGAALDDIRTTWETQVEDVIVQAWGLEKPTVDSLSPLAQAYLKMQQSPEATEDIDAGEEDNGLEDATSSEGE